MRGREKSGRARDKIWMERPGIGVVVKASPSAGPKRVKSPTQRIPAYRLYRSAMEMVCSIFCPADSAPALSENCREQDDGEGVGNGGGKEDKGECHACRELRNMLDRFNPRELRRGEAGSVQRWLLRLWRKLSVSVSRQEGSSAMVEEGRSRGSVGGFFCRGRRGAGSVKGYKGA
ncbi:MAG: hypothetical protein ACLT76_10810 [Clostridium fessum]